jgi:hypothetical protein
MLLLISNKNIDVVKPTDKVPEYRISETICKAEEECLSHDIPKKSHTYHTIVFLVQAVFTCYCTPIRTEPYIYILGIIF